MKLVCALLVLCLLSNLPAFAKPSITGTYSSLNYNEEGGDLLGFEVTIVQKGPRYKARFQIAEGAPSKVIEVPVEVAADRMAFVIPKPADGAGKYTGRVTQAGWLVEVGAEAMWTLAGQNPVPNKPFLLKRKCSYWRKCPSRSQ